MTTALLHDFPGQRTVALPSVRLRITRRGRIVFAAIVALPIAIAAGVFVLGDGSAIATSADSTTTFEYVQVEPGQSLWEIASVVAPNSDPRDVVSDIVHLNRLSTSNVQPGQQLAIPAQYGG